MIVQGQDTKTPPTRKSYNTGGGAGKMSESSKSMKAAQTQGGMVRWGCLAFFGVTGNCAAYKRRVISDVCKDTIFP